MSLPLWVFAAVVCVVVAAVVFWHYIVAAGVMFAAYKVVTR